MCQIRYPCGTLGMDRLDGRLSILSSRILYMYGRKLVENLVRGIKTSLEGEDYRLHRASIHKQKPYPAAILDP